MKKTPITKMSHPMREAQMHLLQKALILSGVALVAFSAPAQAGFQWKGPITPPAAQQPAAPAPADGMSGLEPVTSWTGQPDASVPAAAPAPMTPPPPMAAPAPQAAPAVPVAPVEATAVAAPAPAGEIVSGFGSGVPLVMALQQVVPAGYQFSFSSGVNPGSAVSWTGGKPWQAVLTDMLSSQGLGFKVQNNVVVIGDFPPPPPPPPPPANDMTPVGGMAPAPQAAPAPVVMAPPSKADQIPSDMMGGAKPAAPEAEKPVDIRREKPSKSFWQRITGSSDDDGADTANTMPERTASGNVYAGPASAPATDSSDVRAMNAARAMDAKGTSAANGGDMSAPPEAVVHPAVNSMADQAMAGAAVSSQPEGNSDWGKPSSSTTAPVPSAMGGTASMPAPVPAPESPPVMEEQHAVDLTAPESSSADMPVAAPPMAATAEKPATPASADAKADWLAKKGDTLRSVLKAWSDQAGVELYWSIDYNYRVAKDIDFTGAYDEAVTKLLDQFSAVRPQPYGQLHQSSDGPRVLVIKSYDLAQ